MSIRVSDAVAWDHCVRHAWFLLHPPPGMQLEPDPFEELVRSQGDAHEARVLAGFPDAVAAVSETDTQRLTRERAPVIYQPRFFDRDIDLIGNPDFLFLRNGEYQVGDAKLAMSLDGKNAIKAQLGAYRRLARSELPGLVFLGDGAIEEVPRSDDAIAERFIDDMRALAATPTMPPTHYSYSKCGACPYRDLCVPAFEEADEITLNPMVEVRAAHGLIDQGIATLGALAGKEPGDIADVPYLKGDERKRRAILQARSLKTGDVHILEPVELPQGTYVHFDVETDPLARGGEAEVYLWGCLAPPYTGDDFAYVWKDAGAEADRAAWSGFLDLAWRYRERWPDVRLVHYSDYEAVQIRRYADRYGDREHPCAAWLLSDTGPLLDLRKIVKATLVLPVYSYGLKTVCKTPELVNFKWRLAESGSQWSIVRYYDYLETASPESAECIKREILTYNEDDVRATQALVEWLETIAA
jgi:uncharacterized protein